MKLAALLCSLPLTALCVCAQEEEPAAPPPVTQAKGGSVVLQTPHQKLNEGSALERVWIAVNDPDMPVAFAKTPGVVTDFTEQLLYRAWEVQLNASTPVQAVEVRFLCFDVWNEHTRTLAYSEVKDHEAGDWTVNPAWGLESTLEAEQHLTSIAYVSRVRTADGQVHTANLKRVLTEARKLSKRFGKQDLEPKTKR